MHRVFGLETEYGITVDGIDKLDVVHESIEIVRSYTAHGASMKWDYQLEDPHQDARGFRAAELLQDTDESAYYQIDTDRPMSFREIKSDLVLANGARFYNDHAHPEYSTPECSTLRQIVAHDKAGERILASCARLRNARLPEGQQVRLYKNNTDFIGHSYGCHDNYLMRRDVPWDRLVAEIVPFLVTRQIFAGAGKVGVEGDHARGAAGGFQISQRADFFEVLSSIDTMNRRPLVNTRDEPHADPALWRRFHVIIGDSNMSEFATALKIGTTALVLDLIERGCAPRIELAAPIEAARAISRDPSRRWIVERRGGGSISAIDIQRLYLDAAREHAPRDEETDWLLVEWERALDDLARDPMLCRDRFDWVAKQFLLETFRESEGLDWSDPWLQSIDLEYSSVTDGLFHNLDMRRVVSDDDIRAALANPPETTRAYFRGRAVARFGGRVSSIQWDEVEFATSAGPLKVSLDPRAEAEGAAIRNCEDFDDLALRLRALQPPR